MDITAAWVREHLRALHRKEAEALAALNQARGAAGVFEMLLRCIEAEAVEQPKREGEAADGRASGE